MQFSRRTLIVRTWPLVLTLGAATSIVAACSAGGITSISNPTRSQTIVTTVGAEVRITLGNIGPAEYDTMPDISSTAVDLLGVEVVPPFTPGGPTQQFRFRAVHIGQAIIDLRRSLSDSVVSVVEDTIDVR